jgi:hypothetical protein
MAPCVASEAASAMRRWWSASLPRRSAFVVEGLDHEHQHQQGQEPKIAAENEATSCSPISFS